MKMKIVAKVSANRYHGDDTPAAFEDFQREIKGFSIRGDGSISSLTTTSEVFEEKWIEIKPGMSVNISFVFENE